MKKILILVMSCRNEYFQEEVELIKKTWASKLPKNVKVLYYDGEWKKQDIEEDNDIYHIKCTSPDGLEFTFLKTIEAIKIVKSKFKFDWIFRTNTSTFVNIPLLNKLADEGILNDDIYYGTDLYSLTEAPCPAPLDIYPRGNGILLSKKHCDILVNESIGYAFLKIVDDVMIGNIINTYYIKTTGDYMPHLEGLPHAWYKCTIGNGNNRHRWCRYGESGNQEFYNNFLTVQTKMYRQRENEHQNAEELWDMMKDAPEPSTRMSVKNMENPPVFIGSILGYIPLSIWESTPRQALYEFEMNNKAIDDRQSKNFSQEAYDALHRIPNKK